MPPLTVPDFVARWQAATISEHGAAQPRRQLPARLGARATTADRPAVLPGIRSVSSALGLLSDKSKGSEQC